VLAQGETVVADEPTTGQEPTPVVSQEPTAPPTPPAPTGPEPTGTAPERYDAEYVKELRRSEAATRKRLAEAEARLKADEDAKLSEQERQAKRIADLEAQVAERDRTAAALRLQHAVERTARELGFADPADAALYLDREAVELGEDGAPRNVKALLGKVLEAKPYLKGQDTSGPKGVPGTPRPAGPVTAPEREAHYAARLTSTGAYDRL
jgi:hypothetical protein